MKFFRRKNWHDCHFAGHCYHDHQSLHLQCTSSHAVHFTCWSCCLRVCGHLESVITFQSHWFCSQKQNFNCSQGCRSKSEQNFCCHLELQLTVAWMQLCFSCSVEGRKHVTAEGWVQACSPSGTCSLTVRPLVSETGYGTPFLVPKVSGRLQWKQLLLETAQRSGSERDFPPAISSSLWEAVVYPGLSV